MASSPRALTVDDVLDLPLPNGISGYEFVDGKPVPVTPASRTHGRLIVEVTDGDDHLPRRRRAESEDEAGRGISIVAK